MKTVSLVGVLHIVAKAFTAKVGDTIVTVNGVCMGTYSASVMDGSPTKAVSLVAMPRTAVVPTQRKPISRSIAVLSKKMLTGKPSETRDKLHRVMTLNQGYISTELVTTTKMEDYAVAIALRWMLFHNEVTRSVSRPYIYTLTNQKQASHG